MLVLSRRTDESIVIGDEVTITILSVKGKQVRVGIAAPPDVSVHREEIYQRLSGDEEVSGSKGKPYEPPKLSEINIPIPEGKFSRNLLKISSGKGAKILFQNKLQLSISIDASGMYVNGSKKLDTADGSLVWEKQGLTIYLVALRRSEAVISVFMTELGYTVSSL